MTENKKTQGNFLLRYKFAFKRGAATPRKLKGVTRVCWLEPPAEDCPQAAFLGTDRGADKCRHAELVITDEINKLSDGQTLSANKQLVVDLIYIIALGKPVVTATAWRMAGGRPNDVAASDILRHVALATGEYRDIIAYFAGARSAGSHAFPRPRSLPLPSAQQQARRTALRNPVTTIQSQPLATSRQVRRQTTPPPPSPGRTANS